MLAEKWITAALGELHAKRETAEARFNGQVAAAMAESEELRKLDRLSKEVGAKIAITAMTGSREELAALKEKSRRLSDEKAALLKAAGVPDKAEESCKLCHDSGYRDGELCPCVLTRAKQLALMDLCGTMRGIGCDFGSFDLSLYPDVTDENGHNPRSVMQKLFTLAQNFVTEFPRGKNLLFMGKPGLGKTHLSLAIASEVVMKGYDVIYGATATVLSKAVRENMDWDSDGSYLDRLCRCDLLVLDDLGTEFASGPAAMMLYTILNNRLQAGLSTVISTNLDWDELEKRYEPRIVSRFVGDYTMRYFLGNDIRQILANRP